MKRIGTVGLAPLTVLVLSTLTSATLQTRPKEQKLKPSQLPAAVAQTIKTTCPNCVIDEATREVENGVTIYDIEFKRGQGEMDVAEDGSVIDRETVVRQTEVPAPALDAIRKAGGKIKQIAKDEVRAELKDGTVVKLDNPKYLYEADLVKGNQVAEIQVSPEGQVTEAPKWRSRGTPEN
ncbi:MAG TPA: hypothetical protein VIG25_25345 [Pyrinomonadaceae bacterium]|jgi:uncharacterized membrane protein YkoI